MKHALVVTVEPFKFSPAQPVAYELSHNSNFFVIFIQQIYIFLGYILMLDG